MIDRRHTTQWGCTIPSSSSRNILNYCTLLAPRPAQRHLPLHSNILSYCFSRMPMHLPFTPNHVQLISACYPPNAALLTAGPEYRPNSQELSRMTYYASNRPGKINKLASELEKRARLDSRKAKAGNIRARSYVRPRLTLRPVTLDWNFQITAYYFGHYQGTSNRVSPRSSTIDRFPIGIRKRHSYVYVV